MPWEVNLFTAASEVCNRQPVVLRLASINVVRIALGSGFVTPAHLAVGGDKSCDGRSWAVRFEDRQRREKLRTTTYGFVA
jgi:hypothetical protein